MEKEARSTLMRIANKIHSMGRSRSEAMKAAWKLLKDGWVCKLEGTSYNQTQVALRNLSSQPARIDFVKINTRIGIQVQVKAYSHGAVYNLGFLPYEVSRVFRSVGCILQSLAFKVVGGDNGLNYGGRVKFGIAA